jgi:hypothetical protein
MQTFAQDDDNDNHTILVGVPDVALLDVEGGATINLSATPPTEAGDPISFGAANSDLWINYSSIIGSSTEPSRTVSVAVTQGSIPSGIVINLEVGNDAGNGGGSLGTPETQIALSVASQTIITGIGSSYTGDGASSGHNLSYSGALSNGGEDYSQLDFDENNTLTVTYTLSDN